MHSSSIYLARFFEEKDSLFFLQEFNKILVFLVTSLNDFSQLLFHPFLFVGKVYLNSKILKKLAKFMQDFTFKNYLGKKSIGIGSADRNSGISQFRLNWFSVSFS